MKANFQRYMQVLACAALALVAAPSVLAAPSVVFDAGAAFSEPITRYTHVLDPQKRFQVPEDPAAKQRLQQQLLERIREHGGQMIRLPIRTPSMSPAPIKTQDAYFANLLMPIFVVGADQHSLQWLRAWHQTLVRVGAMGWVVQAENAEDLQAIAEAGKGLRMLTLSGDAIPKIFGVSSYPVLITSRSIEQ